MKRHGKYLFKVLLTITTLVWTTLAFGADPVTVIFTWTPNTDDTVGYNLYMDSGSNLVQTVEGRETSTMTYIITESDVCHNFALQAYDSKGTKSDLSYFLTYCPPKKMLQIPGQYIITIEEVPSN